MSSNVRVLVHGLGKTYHLYRRPGDRLLQMALGRLRPGTRLFTEFHALTDINFCLGTGEVLGIVGQNGAGKSTLLQIICGTLAPTTGTVQVHGRLAALLELGAGFNPEFTGRENVYLSAAVLGLSREEIEARFAEIVAFADIGPFLDQPVKTYSSGMFVRLAFAVATSVDPDILVIDEALAVGDGAFARKSFDRILALKERGVTILLCSHALYQIEAFCTRALWLHGGRIQQLGPPGEVVAAYSQYLAHLSAAPQPQAAAPPQIPPPPPGSGRITAVTVALDGTCGQRLTGRCQESELTVTVRFTLDPALPLPTVGVVLDYGTVVAAASAVTKSDGMAVQRHERGHGVAVVRFPALALRKGEYRVSVYLACEQAIHLYDQAIGVATLTLEDPAPEPGLVRLPHDWRTGHLLVHGRPFVVDPADSLGLFASDGVFEPAETAFFARVLQPGMRVLDVGANMGYHTLRLAQLVGPTGLVVAVEPDPQNQELLAANLAPEIAAGLVRLVPAALGAAPGRMRLYLAPSCGMHRLYPSVVCSTDAVDVEVLPGDALGLAPLDLIKLDVEGYEPAALAGLAATVAASPRVLIVAEFSPLAMLEAGFSPQGLVADLVAQGFSPHTLTEDGTPRPEDPAALTAACARLCPTAFAPLRQGLAGQGPEDQAAAAQAWLAARGYGRPLTETLVWSRQPLWT